MDSFVVHNDFRLGCSAVFALFPCFGFFRQGSMALGAHGVGFGLGRGFFVNEKFRAFCSVAFGIRAFGQLVLFFRQGLVALVAERKRHKPRFFLVLF